MKIHKSEFIGSYPSFNKIPKSDNLEICFWGRSNVGKSSLINYLCDRKDLAKTSSTPGKTQTLNLFCLNDNIYLMDLPGYGYARVSKSIKEKWMNMIFEYIVSRENLFLCYLLIDGSIPIQKNDVEIMERLANNNIPFYIVFTKIDKVTKLQRAKILKDYKIQLSKYWETMPPMIDTSTSNRTGAEVILDQIHHFKQNEPQ